MWGVRVAVAKVVILCCILRLPEAFEQDEYVQQILGQNSRTAPLYVHYNDDPSQVLR